MQDFALRRVFGLGRLIAIGLLAVAMVGCPTTMPPDGGTGRPVDTDGDGVNDDNDLCADTPAGAEVDGNGCAASQRDTDGDGVTDDVDQCADTPQGDEVDNVGCTIPPTVLDTDGDGIADANDDCPNSPAGATVDQNGCAASQRDTDGDGVTDNIDQCPDTPAEAQADEFGCGPGQTGAPDEDGDGVRDTVDQCPQTPAGAIVDADGCAASQLDTDGDGVTDDIDECPDTNGSNVDAVGCASNQRDTDGDGVTDDADRCPGTPAGTSVDSQGCATSGGGTPVCGNGVVESGEQCEPPGSRCCNATCQNISGGEFTSDDCADATALCDDEGSFAFDNSGATLDGPAHTACVFFGEDQIDHDVWSCWTAPCSGTVFVSTCDSNTTVDTKIAVYDGCECPATDARLLSCNDDVCDTQSVVTFEAVAGQSYLLRLGTFPDEPGGAGSVQISCGLDACEQADGDCFAAHASPGCDTGDCCETICAIDPFCCNTEWDQVCADEADGFCGDGFTACGEGAGSCTNPDGNGTPGCDDVACCNAVCQSDPFCCGVGGEEGTWDDLCAEAEAAICHSSCGPRTGDCFAKLCSGGTADGSVCETDDDCPGDGALCAGNGSPGCEIEDCCAEVCPRDPFCCQTEWDAPCAETARALCTAP